MNSISSVSLGILEQGRAVLPAGEEGARPGPCERGSPSKHGGPSRRHLTWYMSICCYFGCRAASRLAERGYEKEREESLGVEVLWASHRAGPCHHIKGAAGHSWQTAGGGGRGCRGRLRDPRLGAGGQHKMNCGSILYPCSGFARALRQVSISSLIHHLGSERKATGCLQHTLFEVAISFCSSLDEVMTGTLQKGS